MKEKRKKPRILRVLIFIFIIGIIAFSYKSTIILGYQRILEKEYKGKTISDSAVTITANNLSSPNVIVIGIKDNAILLEKNSNEKIYPASLTKIMTAIVAIEKLPNLKEEIKLTNSTFKGLYGSDASLAGFKPGEEVKAIDLLYGALLPSGAECCIGLANKVSGSEQNFVKIMNEKAASLGMKNTHFENTTGLQNKNHYTTVKDMAILLKYALKNNTFRKIFTSSSYSTSPNSRHPEGLTFSSTLFEELNKENITDGKILGGKTGYTNEAGLCLASLAKVGKEEYIMVSAGAKGNHNSKQYNVMDAVAVYNSIGNKR